MTALGDGARALLDAANYVVVATSNTDGSPHTSVMWATHEGDELLLSTVQGRKKETNWLLDPRVSVLILDRDDVYHYVEVRGRVQMTTDGGPELIERLSQLYTGRRYTGDEGTDHIRVVVRVIPSKVINRGAKPDRHSAEPGPAQRQAGPAKAIAAPNRLNR